MARIPPEKPLTGRQLRRKVGLYRFVMAAAARFSGAPREIRGRELFLETAAGRVRVLGYGLEHPESLPLFVNIHGGGFTMASADMDDPFMPGLADRARVKVLSVEYGLAPEAPFPAALEQCYAVVKYAKENAEELGIDPERIAVGGHSAGGNLSAAICLLDAERKELGLKALILDYPPLDLYTDPYLKPRPKHAIPPRMARVFDAAYCGSREAGKNPLISPCFATGGQVRSFPPVLLISAGSDSLAPEEAAFKDKLEAAGVLVTYRMFEGCRHGFTHMGAPEAPQAWDLMSDHLKAHLSPEAEPRS